MTSNAPARSTSTSRKLKGASETQVFLSPVMRSLGRAWRHFHFVIAVLILLYATSGITEIEENEAGLVLRLGKLTQSAGEPVVHRPGILFALPRPFDEVVKLQVDRIETITIAELAPPSWRDTNSGTAATHLADSETVQLSTETLSPSIDPDRYAYVLTGDRNILHTQILARYRISDPIDFALRAATQQSFLRATILESTIRITGQAKLDDLLGGGRDRIALAVALDAQHRLDRIGVGLEIVSLEFQNLSPPEQVAADFDAVQSAYIEAQTAMREAQAYAVATVPAAEAGAQQAVADAVAEAHAQTSRARAEADAFLALLPSYRSSPELVRQRLYQEGVERALQSVASLRFVPAPVADGYQGTRFLISRPDRATPDSGADVRRGATDERSRSAEKTEELPGHSATVATDGGRP